MLKKSPFNFDYFIRYSLMLLILFVFMGTVLAEEPVSDLEESIENKEAQVLHHLGYRSTTGFMAGSFTKEGPLPNEFVDEVTFFCNEKESQYKITVITQNEEGRLSSGKIRYVQEGMASFSGYQKVSLNKGVLLNQGERFAIVIEITSPTKTMPLTTIEPPGNFDDEIGETFLSKDGIHWEAHPFMGIGVVLKKENSIEASIKEKEVKHKDRLYLSAKDRLKNGEVSLDPLENTFENKKEPEIYYTLDGSDPQENGLFYDAKEGILINAHDFTKDHLLIKACVRWDWESVGKEIDFNYTLKKAGLSQLKLIDENGEKTLDPKENNAVDVLSSIKTIQVQATAEAGCQIKINNVVIASGSKQNIDLKAEDEEIHIDVYDENQEIWEEEQLKPSRYYLKISKKPVIYDFKNEKIIFDHTRYSINSLSNNDGIEILNGEVISPYLGGNLYVTPKNKEAAFSITVPARPQILDLTLNFKTKKTVETLSEAIIFGLDSELKDPIQGRNQAINVTPGTSLYYQKIASENQFASEIKKLEIPELPMPPIPKARKIETNRITLEAEKNTLYRKNNEAWQTDPVFERLISGETYSFDAQKMSTKDSFGSKIGSYSITTRKMILKNQEPYFEYLPKENEKEIVMQKDIRAVDVLKTGSIKESVMVIVMGLFGCGILLFIVLSYVYAFEEKKKKEKKH